ncbi:MAG: biotin--[acetyl-CoA-carboxylase] ligase [Bacteroidetes bacterium]|jgi:BirA family biotin operon repressor/biotin-[acetyl-CoA-carboxylase] ligase|nr:biotin--[acetyl-CoA-carboxylase] ligase [Bacteroidota bacterium]
MDTLFIGTNTIHLSEVDSTNSYANALLKDVKPPEGTLVWADHQTAGKGMRGNVWLAESRSNITASYILYPSFLSATDHFILSKAVALAVHATLTELLNVDNYDIKIKWPNDILINGKKVAGILIENSFREERMQAAVIGIGLNLNQADFAGLSDKATSVYLLTNLQMPREPVLQKISKHLEVMYLQLKQGKIETINELYLKHLLHFAEDADFFDIGKEQHLRGKIVDVQENGTLEILTTEGELRFFDLKEIRFGYY